MEIEIYDIENDYDGDRARSRSALPSLVAVNLAMRTDQTKIGCWGGGGGGCMGGGGGGGETGGRRVELCGCEGGRKRGRTLNGEMMMLSVSDVNRGGYIVNRYSRLPVRGRRLSQPPWH